MQKSAVICKNFRREIDFRKQLIVNIYFSTFDHDSFAGKTDDPFNIIKLMIFGSFKDNHVSAPGRGKAIGNFIRQNVFAVIKIGIHGIAFNLVRLNQKKVNHHKNRQGNNHGLYGVQKKVADFLGKFEHKSNVIVI